LDAWISQVGKASSTAQLRSMYGSER